MKARNCSAVSRPGGGATCVFIQTPSLLEPS
jgi:hypothetical protein